MQWVLKTRNFTRWADDAGLRNKELCAAIDEMNHGLIDAKLGGHIFKKRIAMHGRGKRGGGRTILASNLGDKWFFLYGFAKNEKENLTEVELAEAKTLAASLLSLSDELLLQLVEQRQWERVVCQ